MKFETDILISDEVEIKARKNEKNKFLLKEILSKSHRIQLKLVVLIMIL